MSRLQEVLLILGCAVVLWLEAPHAWNVFASDLGRAVEPAVARHVEKLPAKPGLFAIVPLASLPAFLWMRAGAKTTVAAAR